MLRLLILTLLTSPIITIDQAYAEHLHAVLVGDTLDGSIGAGITENLKNMNMLLSQVEAEGQISISKTEVKDSYFNCKAIAQAVDRLNVAPTDTVLFYYSGHGFRRDSTQTKFPEFDCRRTSDPDRAELAGIVNDLVQTKKPRLILAIADTCNKPVATSIATPPAAAFAPDRRLAFQRLFSSYSGTLMMSGAVPGEYSWYSVSSSPLGGFFTNQLLRAINQKILEEGEKVRWEDIAADATKTIFIPGLSEPTYQNPQSAALNLAIQTNPSRP